MKRLGDPSFFFIFDRILSAIDPMLKADQWQVDGALITKERHSFFGQTHNFISDAFNITFPGRKGWTLLVVKEHWWKGDQNRDQRWVMLTSGHRTDVMLWLKKQGQSLNAK